MPKYDKMYAILCSAISEALDCLDRTPWTDKAIYIMQNALEKAEDIYCEDTED